MQGEFLVNVSDERRQARADYLRRLQRLAEEDPLTSLPNRAACCDRSGIAVESAAQAGAADRRYCDSAELVHSLSD
jgi:GGDEF domain-containing protein